MNFAFIQLDWSKIKIKLRNNFRKFGLRRVYCSREQEILWNDGGFPITEIRIIESILQGFLKDGDYTYVPIRERFGLERIGLERFNCNASFCPV